MVVPILCPALNRSARYATQNRTASVTKKLYSRNKVETPRRGSGAQIIYETLRHDILCLQLAPGEMLDEVVLCGRFGMSRSPVREALIRLAGEGLVTTLPNKSTIVTPLNVEDYPVYVDALDLVQRVTTRLAARLRNEEDLRVINACQMKFLKTLDAGDITGMIETNRDFHVAISEAGRNRYFNFLHARLLDDGRRMLHLYFRSFGESVPHSIRRDHDLIIKAIQLGDEDLAEKCAHDHVMQVGKRFIEYFASRQTLNFDISPPD